MTSSEPNFDYFSTLFLNNEVEKIMNDSASLVKKDLQDLLNKKISTSMSEDEYLTNVITIIIKYSAHISVTNPLEIIKAYHQWLISNFELLPK
ncbi:MULTISPECIES: hypothetical protein [Clostridium]|uniref:Uncharacterized protein n=1 Tax=Clostridium butyricum TaxID=1492 RepID=A0A512TR48_CLOBU|nr:MULTISPECIES: hypothetical protein [Clostridium]DAQ80607.1 MAG TPA: hypothetical protein [Inoviridae sp.]MDU1339800.1 hypothetical protein [Clostridium butyricum]NOW22142.1 hypothetical protein [Clostridium butyricum]OFS23486.1 hypothetical protein HMPREF3070_08440 [Clostridium sp. HMSC19A10]GEQ22757.1 hypothetical protein CBU02nite_32630 [Clostridium butyricum]